MRNLKRVLSLALAVVMVIGMMVMTTGAADIADIDDVKNVEAVTVMNALKVLEGDENGVYNPTGILTREQAAKIICFMLMGADNAKMLTGTTTYTDVEADRWSAPYIAYCSSLDIISGYDGKFDPTGELTGVAFAKMLLVALGYDAAIEGYVNNANWATNIGSDAIDAGINIKGVDLAAAVTRDNAAQMALNTLKATMVRYDSKGTNITMGDGTSIIVGADAAEPVVPMNGEDYSYDQAGNATIQFCEKYFGKLKTVNGGSDAFGRPNSHAWELDSKPVITIAKKAAFTFTAGTKPAALTKALAGYTIGDKKINETYTLTADITVGDLTIDISATDTTAKGIAAALKNGTLVELYANKDKEIEDVVIVDYNVSKVTNVVTNKTTGDVTYTLANVGTRIDYADDEVYTDTIKLHGDIGKFDVVTVCTDGNGKVHVYPTTSFEGTQTAYKTVQGVRTLTIDGESYVVGEAAADVTDFDNKKADWTYFVDQYGFVVALEEIEKAASEDYVYILDVDQKVAASYGDTSTTVKVKTMMADGTKGEYTVAIEGVNAGNLAKVNGRNDSADVAVNDFVLADTKVLVYDADATPNDAAKLKAESNLLGKVFGYTFNEDGEIELELLGTASGTMTKKDVYTETLAAQDPGETLVGARTLLTDDTTFVVYNAMKKTVTSYTAAEAEDAFATVTGVSVITATSETAGTASVVFANATTDAAATKVDVVYVDASAYVVSFDVKGDTIYTYTAYTVDGEEIEQTASSTTGIASGLYERNNKDEIEGAPEAEAGVYLVYESCTIEGGMLNNGSNFYTYDNAKVVDLTRDQYGMAEDGFNAYIVLNKKPNGDPTKDIAAIFVVE